MKQCIGEGNGNPLQHSCLENPMDGGAWWAAVHGAAQSRTRLSNFTFIFHFSLSCVREGNGNPLQCSCLENPRDRRAWWAAVYGVAQSQTWLKRLSSSCSKIVILSLPFPGSTSPILSNVIDVDRVKTPSLFWLFFFIWILARQFHTQVFSSIYWQRDCPHGHWEVVYCHI